MKVVLTISDSGGMATLFASSAVGMFRGLTEYHVIARSSSNS